MSASTPNPKPNKSGLPIWWGVSIAFHALLLTWLIFFSPVRVVDLTKKSATGNISPARAQQIMEQVREKQAANLATTVRDLQDIQKQLADLESRKNDEFKKFAKDFNTNAPVQIEQAQAAAAQAQADVIAIQTNAAGATGATLDALQKQSATKQLRVAESQERALEMLSMADKRFAEAYQAQVEANGAQDRAAKAQLDARSARDAAKASRAKDHSAEIAGARDIIASMEKARSQISDQISTFSNSLAAAQSAIAAGNTNSPGAIKALANAKKQADIYQRNIRNVESQLPRISRVIADQKARIEKLEAETAALPAAANDEQLVALQAKAAQLQTDAQQAQARARETFAIARSRPAPADAGSASLSNPSASASPPLDHNVDKMDLAQLYQASVKSEDALTESYRRLRATELAMIRQIPLARAMELTDTAKVVRPELQSALTNNSDIAAQRDAVANTRAEINSIHQLASSILAQARDLDRFGSSSPTGSPLASDDLQSAITRAQSLDSLAAEDDTQRAKDLTAAMKGSGSAGRGKSGFGKSKSSGTGSSSRPGGSGTGTGSSGASVALGGSGSGKDAGDGSGAGTGSDTGSGAGAGSGSSSGNGSGDGTSSGPGEISKSVSALPGRTVAASGESPRWMFVDSWYLLGPFDNVGRVNLEKKFPPETIVDRDAIYGGKSGSRVRWEFYQSAEAKIVPPFRNFKGGLEYIIYYACTELRFDEDCDLWVAIGSDDFSKVWVNDQLIWSSGKQQKKWRVDEGFRKVHFQKGVNHVLYRVENGHGQTEFSLVIGMP